MQSAGGGLRTSFSAGKTAAAPPPVASYAVPRPAVYASAPVPSPGPIQYYAAHQTNYSSDVGTYQNTAPMSYRLSDLHPDTQTYLQQLPPEWLHNSSAEQFEGLVNELEEFHSNLYNNLTINRPSLQLPSVVPPVIPPVLPHPTIIYTPDDPPTSGTVPPTPLNNTDQAHHESSWFNRLDLGKGIESVGGIGAGIGMINKFAPVLGEAEASGAVGESLVASIEAPLAGTLLEGVGAGVVEALGGVAAVGGFIAGGEIIAGVAAIGFGLYEGYEALGGTPIGSQVESQISSTFKSGVSAFESFIHWP